MPFRILKFVGPIDGNKIINLRRSQQNSGYQYILQGFDTRRAAIHM